MDRTTEIFEAQTSSEPRFDQAAAFDEGWWPRGSARTGMFLVACLMGLAMVMFAQSPAFAAADSSVAVTADNNPVKVGQAVAFTATVTPSTATGTVQFKIDGANAGSASPISGGKATLAMSSAPAAGTHTVSAEYSGDATVNGSTGTLAGGLQVNRGESTTTVTSSRNPAKLHEPVTFTVNVLPSTAGGTVQLKMDGEDFGSPMTLHNGTASRMVMTMSGPPSTHTLTAEYRGDSNFKPSTGTLAGGQRVIKGDTRTEVTSSKNPARPGEDITIKASVFPSVVSTGTVQFKIDGEEIDEPVALSDGVAEIELTSNNDSIGTSVITAEYSGDASFNPSTGTLSQVVSGKTATTTKLTFFGNSNQPDERGFIATITPSAATGTVQFKLDGANLGGPVPVTNGVAKSGLTKLSPASHTVVAEYSGDANFSPSSDSITQPGPQVGPKIATSLKLTYGINTVQMSKAVTFHAAITPREATGTVQFKLDGKNLGSPVPVKDGAANSTAVSLAAGNHKVEAEYSGDAHFQPSRAVMDKVNVRSPGTPPRVLPRTGSSTLPLALLAVALMVSGVLIQRRASRMDAEKMPPEDYRF